MYAHDAIDKLCLKRNHLHDLLDETPFAKADILVLQDPGRPDRQNIGEFYYVKQQLNVPRGPSDDRVLNHVSTEATSILDELRASQATVVAPRAATAIDSQSTARDKALEDAWLSLPEAKASYSLNQASASFTSTAATPVTQNQAALKTVQQVRYGRVRQKGYAALTTSLGKLNLEVFL